MCRHDRGREDNSSAQQSRFHNVFLARPKDVPFVGQDRPYFAWNSDCVLGMCVLRSGVHVTSVTS
jgi:hypothetical protein